MADYLAEFKDKIHLYEKLMQQTRQSIEMLLKENNIDVFSIEGRVKALSSFEDKVMRKSYLQPLKDVKDLCGLRVICYYESDLNSIERIIVNNFDVISKENKLEQMGDDKFGYSSRHFIVKLKSEWLSVPQFKGLNGLEMEIQTRTMLMHAWAAISHKLLYKKENDAPQEIKRSLSKLSALMELADEQFSGIREKKSLYIEKFNEPENRDVENEELNSDNLISLIRRYFPERGYSESHIPSLLNEIKRYDLYVKDFENRIKLAQPYLAALENDEADIDNEQAPFWEMEGLARTILDLTCDDYFERHGMPDEYLELAESYRNKIKKDTFSNE